MAWGRFNQRLAINTINPAGTSRIPAIKKGAVWGIAPFIATIAVPQRKKGAISNSGWRNEDGGDAEESIGRKALRY
jgi:hypothetical protein